MTQQQWVPAEVDPDTPSAARMYDFFLGGAHNFEADRRLAKQVIARFPDIIIAARANRDFVMRAVRYLATMGIDQFLDVGCGLPSTSMVHRQAQSINPRARVVYVDNEPVAVAHGMTMLDGVPGAEIVQADLRYPATFLEHEVTRGLLDFGRPVAVLLAAVLHFVRDEDDPAAAVAGIRDALTPGSALVVSHVTDEGAASIEEVRKLYEQSQNPGQVRSREQVAALLAGFTLVSPGVVWVPEWLPEDTLAADVPASRSHLYGAVGLRP